MEQFLKSEKCLSFVKADVEKVRRHNYECSDSDETSEDEDECNQNQMDNPDWMDMIQPFAEMTESDHTFDDGGQT